MRLRALLVLLVLFLASSSAQAFCGFYVSEGNSKLYNNATQVVMLRDGTRTVLSMQNNYQGPPEKFAMIVPVPVVLQKENVKTLERSVFDKIDQLDSPRLVEYWEQDPCLQPIEDKLDYKVMRSGAMPTSPVSAAEAVRVEAKFAVGEYDIVILSADDAGALDAWLKAEHYAVPAGAEPYLRPYVQAASKFFVAKVDPQRVKFENGMATLSPLRFHYDTETFTLPIRLGLINAKDAQDLIVHILAKGKRFETTNYPNVTIPTNLDVEDSVRGNFGSFYAALFDETVKKTPKAVVTEYSWDASSCDPCPGPALNASDLEVFGADTLAQHTQGPWGWTITRLHARYTKESLGADLVFREAPGIVGGREFVTSDGHTLEKGSQPAATNNFQGRYAIRHPWTGAIACENPHRGVWGANPKGESAQPTPARNLAFAARGGVQLASLLHTDVTELGIAAKGEPYWRGEGGRSGDTYAVFGIIPVWVVAALLTFALVLGIVRVRGKI